MNIDERVFQIALTLIPNIGPVQARILLQHFDAPGIFKAKRSVLENIEGIGTIRANAIRSFRDFDTAEKEIRNIEKTHTRTLFLTDKDYPQRLLHCADPPTLLYFRGNADLNTSPIIAVIGTRHNSEYGRQVTEKLIEDLAARKVLVISGLAYGIDSIAHRSALKNELATIGVLAHGLHTIYPYDNYGLAKEMCRCGGLLTEFRNNFKPDKHNFPVRNRVVAGMSDATIVIETGIKGGSMITAELANGYNKDVFAFPGRATDIKSAGCNHLIRENKAILITGADDLVNLMGWEAKSLKERKRQRELFIELSDAEQVVFDLLKECESMHIDELNLKAGMSNSAIAAAILGLELKGVVISKPGKLYSLS
jgi:DNA processing protein